MDVDSNDLDPAIDALVTEVPTLICIYPDGRKPRVYDRVSFTLSELLAFIVTVVQS
jgi:hypothetical protein